MSGRPAIVAYDIASNKRRRRVRGVLAEWRLDGQLSVHACLLTNSQADELFSEIAAEIDPEHDRLLLAWVLPRRRVLARGRSRTDTFERRLAHVE